jgi:hypothetical protein
MCHLSIAIDQSIHTIAPVFDAIEDSPFYIRSVRLAPVAWSRRADVHLSLGGGSNRDLKILLNRLQEMPAILATQHTMPPI